MLKYPSCKPATELVIWVWIGGGGGGGLINPKRKHNVYRIMDNAFGYVWILVNLEVLEQI